MKRIKVQFDENFVMEIKRGKQTLGELIINTQTLKFQMERNLRTGLYKSKIKIAITNPSADNFIMTEYTGNIEHF